MLRRVILGATMATSPLWAEQNEHLQGLSKLEQLPQIHIPAETPAVESSLRPVLRPRLDEVTFVRSDSAPVDTLEIMHKGKPSGPQKKRRGLGPSFFVGVFR